MVLRIARIIGTLLSLPEGSIPEATTRLIAITDSEAAVHIRNQSDTQSPHIETVRHSSLSTAGHLAELWSDYGEGDQNPGTMAKADHLSTEFPGHPQKLTRQCCHLVLG